jgi:hypothetical protein
MESLKKISFINDAISLCLETLQLRKLRAYIKSYTKTRFDYE